MQKGEDRAGKASWEGSPGAGAGGTSKTSKTCLDRWIYRRRQRGKQPADSAQSQWEASLPNSYPEQHLLRVGLYPEPSINASRHDVAWMASEDVPDPITWPSEVSMSSQECGILPFMDSKVRCQFRLAAGNEEHRRQMEAASTHSMLILLTSGPGNGWSFAPPSRLRDAASKLTCL